MKRQKKKEFMKMKWKKKEKELNNSTNIKTTIVCATFAIIAMYNRIDECHDNVHRKYIYSFGMHFIQSYAQQKLCLPHYDTVYYRY